MIRKGDPIGNRGIEVLRGILAGIPGLSTDDLLALRNEERELEERKARDLLGRSSMRPGPSSLTSETRKRPNRSGMSG